LRENPDRATIDGLRENDFTQFAHLPSHTGPAGGITAEHRINAHPPSTPLAQVSFDG